MCAQYQNHSLHSEVLPTSDRDTDAVPTCVFGATIARGQIKRTALCWWGRGCPIYRYTFINSQDTTRHETYTLAPGTLYFFNLQADW